MIKEPVSEQITQRFSAPVLGLRNIAVYLNHFTDKTISFFFALYLFYPLFLRLITKVKMKNKHNVPDVHNLHYVF